MADDKRPDGEAAPAEASRSIVFTIAIVAVILIVPALAAFLTFRFAIQAMADPAETAGGPRQTTDRIPDSVQTVPFEQQYTSVRRESDDYPASTFAFKVAFDVSTAQAASLIERRKANFISMIADVHSFRSRAELDDPLVKQSIQRTIRDKANEMLRRYGASERDQVLDVFHEQYVVQD